MSTPLPLTTRTIFSDANLQLAVDHALQALPAEHTFAVLAHADLEGASLTAVVRAGDHWTIEAAAIKPWNGPLTAQAEVILSY